MIKDSRDVQKLSKLGIYAVIRGNLEDAKRKLCDAADIANKIFVVVNQVGVDFHYGCNAYIRLAYIHVYIFKNSGLLLHKVIEYLYVCNLFLYY